MEKSLEMLANETLNDTIVGYICSDSNGYCLHSSGVADPNFSSTMFRVAKLATLLDDKKNESMVIGISTDRHQIYIKPHGNTTTAIYKKN